MQLSAIGDAAAGGAVRLDDLARLVDQLVGEQSSRSLGIVPMRMLATACAAIPSRRPVKPRPSVVVALMLTWSTRKPSDLGDPRAHRVAMRADLRRFGDDRAIDMVDDRSRAHGAGRRHGRGKRSEAAPFHVRVRRREMLADIAERRRRRAGRR